MTVKGIVQGKTIELQDDPHLPDGEEVDVEIHANISKQANEQSAFSRSAGIIPYDPNDDEILNEIYQARKAPSRATQSHT